MAEDRFGTGLARLDALPRYAVAGSAAVKPGLERIRKLLERLGDPDRRYPIVHVAGTNGKGSTASMIASICTAAGLRVGLHTSPHLFAVGERMRIDGRPAPEAWIDAKIMEDSDMIDEIRPSYFELTVALALTRFAEQNVDIAVIEVGLGGRLDATNIVWPVVSVITDIGMDHAEILGPTLADIAREKAGIMKAGVPVVAADSGPVVGGVLSGAASACGCPLQIVPPPGDPWVLDLPGSHQQRNAALATTAIRLLRFSVPRFAAISDSHVTDGLARTRELSGLRARLEIVSRQPLVVVDAAHNPEGLELALEFLSAEHDASCDSASVRRKVVLLGVMADKDLVSMARSLAKHETTVVPVNLGVERALQAESMGRVLLDAGCAVCEPLPDPLAGPGWIRRHLHPADCVLVAGSFLLAGPFLSAWEGPARHSGT